MLPKEIFRDNLSFKLTNNKYIFKKMDFSDIQDNLDFIKNKIKKFSKLYSFLIKMISPVYPDKIFNYFLKEYVEGKDVLCINIGSGNSRVHKKVYNLDIFAYDNVDIVCDIEELPFKDNSIDIIINSAVLEHVRDPQQVIKEIYRVLKPGGVVFTAFPFMQGFHASPYDYTRVTKEGIKHLHKNFNEISCKPFGGPTSGLLWIFQEYIAIIFSFGSKKVHMFFYIILMLLTFPFKFLDFLLIHHPMAENIASGFIFIGKK